MELDFHGRLPHITSLIWWCKSVIVMKHQWRRARKGEDDTAHRPFMAQSSSLFLCVFHALSLQEVIARACRGCMWAEGTMVCRSEEISDNWWSFNPLHCALCSEITLMEIEHLYIEDWKWQFISTVLKRSVPYLDLHCIHDDYRHFKNKPVPEHLSPFLAKLNFARHVSNRIWCYLFFIPLL